MSRSFRLRSYLNYWLDCVNSHSLHSPFLFDFYNLILHQKNATGDSFSAIENIRSEMLRADKAITYKDPGSGGDHNPITTQNISDIAKTSLSSARFSRLYERIIRHFGCKNVIELGTSLGINALYLASNLDTRVYTFEGATETAAIARENFNTARASNIQLIEGDIGKTLSPFMEQIRKADFVFMDANHRYEPTLQYFKILLPKLGHASIVVVDDIHYSSGMEKAWNELCAHPLVYTSIDLYRAGILFFDPSLNKQHAVLQF